MIMFSSFYSVQYIVKPLPFPFFHLAHQPSTTLRYLLSLSIDKYCVFAHA
jgi:hypothetical protein